MAKEIFQKYLEDLLFELKKLKAILEIEIEELGKGEVDILNITNTKRDALVESVKSYYKTINSWLISQKLEVENFTKMIEEINSRKNEICTIYNSFEEKLNEIIKDKRMIKSKIKFKQNVFNDDKPILVDLKI